MIAEQADAALRRHVLEPLLAHATDDEYGGFLSDFDDRWRPAGPHHKSLEHAARTTIAFAQLDSLMPDSGCDRVARHGCAFLQGVMWDSEHGGFFASVDRSGRPLWNGLKHPHAVTYAVVAFELARHLLPLGDGDSWVRRALAWLDDIAWDRRDGGYWGSYRRDNQRYEEGACLPTPDGRDILGLTPGFKEINTQGDAIEMLTTVVGSSPENAPAERYEWLVDLVVDRLMDRYGVLPYAYRRDWRPAPGLVRVGHQFQMARRLAVVSADRLRVNDLVASSCQLVDFCLKFARHPAGGFCFAVTADGRMWPETGASSDLRLWWVQFEALHAFHVLSSQEAVSDEDRARYRHERDLQWSFVECNLFDERHRGIREVPPEPGLRRQLHRLGCRGLGQPLSLPRRKSHVWKDSSHEVAALIALAGEHGTTPAEHDIRSRSEVEAEVGRSHATPTPVQLDTDSLP
jgi:mannose/cellobiose epimerase-like protein (N-acyl-D-glucosamine 2-epimerase family)